MAENQKINVFFNTDPDEAIGGDQSWESPEKKRASENALLKDNTKSGAKMLGTMMFHLGQTAVMSVLTRYGSYTGDLMTQNSINNGLQAVQIAISVGMAFAGNPIPLIMTGIQTTLKIVDYQMAHNKANEQAMMLRETVGYVSSNRSRTKGNKV